MTRPDREEEARRALRRLDQQSDKIISGSHPEAAPDDDRIEILGKRIARILSAVIFIGLAVYLWRTYLSG